MFLLITISTFIISSVSATSELNASVAEDTTVSNQTREILTCHSCSNFLIGNETAIKNCEESFCYGEYCFAVLDQVTVDYYTGCINVTDNVEIVEFTEKNNSTCRQTWPYTECICMTNNCNIWTICRTASYADGNIFSTLKFNLVKKAVLVNAAQLADIDQQGEVKGDLTAAISSATYSNATSTPVSTIISTTAVAVTKHSESIFSRDYGLLTVCITMWLTHTFLAVNGA